MIFEQALQRELPLIVGAVFLVPPTFILVTLVTRILGMAANGEANPSDVLLLISLVTPGYLAILPCATLFTLALLVLTRWHKDSEMVVWFISDINLTDSIRLVLRFSLPFIVLVALLALFGQPWANQQSALFRDHFEQRDVLSTISTGHSIEFAHGSYMFFVEGVDSGMEHARNLFVANAGQDKIDVAVAKTGESKIMPNDDRFVALDKDCHYEGTPDKFDYRIVEFDKYGVKVANKPSQADANLPIKSCSTKDLPADPISENSGELIWRIGLSPLALNFMLIAIPPAYVNPCLGRYTPMIFAVLICLTYSNLSNLSQVWVSQGKMNVFMAWRPTHLAAFICAVLLFRFRHYNAAGLKGISALLGFASKKAGT